MKSSSFNVSLFRIDREREIFLRECNVARYGIVPPGRILASQDYE